MRLCCVHTYLEGDQLDRFDPIAVYTHMQTIGVCMHIREHHLAWAYLIDPELTRRRDQDLYE
jgi:hypothetical protein